MWNSLSPRFGVALAVGMVLAGCSPRETGPEAVMATTGPNQVVIKVPGMT
jgi:hypothetical protein